MRRLAILLLAPALLAAELAPRALPDAGTGLDAPFAAMRLLGAADDARERQDWSAAAGHYRDVLALDPALDGARLGLVESLLALGRAGEADELLKPGEDRSARLRIDLALGRLAEPAAALEAGFAATNDPRLLNALGRWRDDRGEGEAARMAFMRADTHQAPGLAQNNIGLSFLREGELERAQAAFDAAAGRTSDPHVSRNRRLCALLRADYAAGLSGLSGADAAPLLREAGAGALARGETRLAALLLERASALSPRFDPRTQALLERLQEE